MSEGQTINETWAGERTIAAPTESSEVASYLADLDWATSPLGPPDTWPNALRSAFSLVLPTRAQVAIFWGPDLLALYNDAYAAAIGNKHPGALGRPARENWSELWDHVEPLMRQVRETGATVYAKDRPFRIERHGYPEMVYFDLSYSAIRDDDDSVGGVLCIVSETTQQVKSIRRARESENRFHALADSIDQMIWTTLPDGFHDYYNQRWYEFTGVPEGTTDGQGWSEMFHPDDQKRAWRIWNESLATGKPYHIEYRLRHRSGAYRWVLGRAQPVRDRSGRIIRWYGTCTDIHESKTVQEALRATEERYRLALSATNDAIWDWDLATGLVQWNEALEIAYGHGPETVEPTGAWWLGQIHPGDRTRIDAHIHEVINGSDHVWADEYRFRRADGSYAEVLDRGTLIRNDAGKPVRMIGAMLDLTERNEAQAAIARSEARYRTLFNAIDVGFCILDVEFDENEQAVDYCFVEANPAFEKQSNFRDAVGKSIRELAPDNDPFWFDTYGRVALTREPVRFEHRDEALNRWFEVYAFPIGDPEQRRVGALFEDISERKMADQALKEESHALETLNLTAGLVAAELDLDKLVQIVTDAGVDLTGAQFGAFFYGSDAGQSGERLRLLYSFGTDGFHFDQFPARKGAVLFEALGGDGAIRSDDIENDPRFASGDPVIFTEDGAHVRSYLAVPVSSRSGEVIGGLIFGHETPGIFTDRSVRLMAGLVAQAAIGIDNARLFQARQRLTETLEAQVAARTAERDRIWQVSEDLLGVADRDGVWLSVNPAWTRVLGWSAGDLVGRTTEWLEHPDDRKRTRAEVSKLAEGEQSISFENRFRTRSGDYRTLLWNAIPEGDMLYCTARDVTDERVRQIELEQTQERLRQAQKMETVGQLTGGVAHDFNNLLQIVTGNLDILLRNLPEDADRLRRSAENARSGAERAATLTQRLLAFSRRQPLAPKALDVNALISSMLDLLHRTLGETIEVNTSLSPGLWRVEADPNQLENALLNLAINGRDAMPEGGSLGIETSNARFDTPYAEPDVDLAVGEYVAISISDSGTGMDEGTLSRVFEPFFTTKEVGKGTGLGLSMVYGFVKQSGGHVQLDSDLGVGTSVRIYLPRLAGEVTEEEVVEDRVVPPGSRDETILVCEDDDDVRAFSVEVLHELGYQVIEAQDGRSALALLERGESKVDLLFTDVVLPGGMTGAVVAERARALLPGLRILYTTGYARDAIVHHGRLDPGVELITKPFTFTQLATCVRTVLDKPA